MTGNLAVGITGVIVASIVWGSNFTVVRKYDMPADGVHFAFLMSLGILSVGLLTILSSPVEDGDFEAVFAPCGLVGGALWAAGNFLTVPIIQCIGLGVGLALWAGTNMIVAFVVGAMGLEGVGQVHSEATFDGTCRPSHSPPAPAANARATRTGTTRCANMKDLEARAGATGPRTLSARPRGLIA